LVDDVPKARRPRRGSEAVEVTVLPAIEPAIEDRVTPMITALAS